MPVACDMFGTLIKIDPHAHVPLTFRLRSVYVPLLAVCLPVTVCLCLSVCLSVCLPVCLSHLNTCAPLMPSNVNVPLFVFQCARSTMNVPRCPFQCARSTAYLAMCAPRGMRSTGHAPRHSSQCMRSTVICHRMISHEAWKRLSV